MLTYLDTFAIYKPSRSYLGVNIRALRTQKVSVIPFYKADFHTFTSTGFRFESFLSEIFPYLLLGISSQWKEKTLKYLLRKFP